MCNRVWIFKAQIKSPSKLTLFCNRVGFSHFSSIVIEVDSFSSSIDIGGFLEISRKETFEQNGAGCVERGAADHEAGGGCQVRRASGGHDRRPRLLATRLRFAQKTS